MSVAHAAAGEARAKGIGTRARRRWWRALLWAAALLAAALAAVRVAAGWVFPVASGSMLPTLRPGEWVFLRWGHGELERFDLVAFRSEGGEAVVKRIWGLPGESILVEATGDVRVDGELAQGPGRPGLIRVYDQRLHPVEDHWHHGAAGLDPWTRVEDGAGGAAWEVDSREISGRSDASLLRHHKGIHDDSIGEDGAIRYGLTTVQDARVSAEVLVVEGGGELRLELREQGDRFEFTLELPPGGGPGKGTIRRRRGEASIDDASATFDVPLGRWFDVAFGNVDDELTVDVEGHPRLSFRYPRNTIDPRTMSSTGAGGAPTHLLGERVFVGADGARVRFRDLVVERDIHVTPAGTFAVGRELRLGLDEIYVLGDDPSNSRDSREMGPIPTARIIGRPLFVAWPPRAWRRL